jgi:zinc transport system substrate-binding protein
MKTGSAMFWALLTAAALASGCGTGDDASPADDAPQVYVSIEPLAFFVERIAGPDSGVGVLVGPGRDPHTFDPTPRQRTALAGAKLLLAIGMPFEQRLVEKLADGDGPKVVDVGEGIERLPATGHHHEEEHAEGEHAELDPHVWMSPRNAKAIAAGACEALCELHADRAEQFRLNLKALQRELDALDAALAEKLAPLKGQTVFVFHPAFGYLLHEYGLRQEAVEFEGKAPGPKHVKHLIHSAKAEGVRVIFVQPQFSEQTAQDIADQIGGVVVPLDPLSRDYTRNLQAIADTIHGALRDRPR